MAISKYSKRTPLKFIVSEEVARDQICELLEYYDIDVDKITDEDGAKAVERALDQLTKFVMLGTLEVTRDDKSKINVIHNLSVGGEKLVYREVDSQAKLAMEKFAPAANFSRTYAFMGSLCGVGFTGISKLPAKDLSVVELLGTVFQNA